MEISLWKTTKTRASLQAIPCFIWFVFCFVNFYIIKTAWNIKYSLLLLYEIKSLSLSLLLFSVCACMDDSIHTMPVVSAYFVFFCCLFVFFFVLFCGQMIGQMRCTTWTHDHLKIHEWKIGSNVWCSALSVSVCLVYFYKMRLYWMRCYQCRRSEMEGPWNWAARRKRYSLI